MLGVALTWGRGVCECVSGTRPLSSRSVVFSPFVLKLPL